MNVAKLQKEKSGSYFGPSVGIVLWLQSVPVEYARHPGEQRFLLGLVRGPRAEHFGDYRGVEVVR
jgi:hypothetical protein